MINPVTLWETKEQIEGDKNKEIEYTYDKQGNLVQVKSSLENEKSTVCPVCL